ncbi:Protein disulfide-isomerase A6 [Lamellibrachia satsuma]|nr:Protein disulfide-isomerase A6 [Lamellibrachia satsuma]
MKLLLGITLCMAVTSAIYTSSDDVVELTQANFNREVIQSQDLWLVEFYAPWCGHCKSLAPEWKKAATALKGVVKVGAVNMDDHSSVGQPYNVRGFPTIKIFASNKNSPQDYNGARSAQSLVDSAMSQLKSMVNDRMSGRGGSGGGGQHSGSGGGRKPTGDEKDVVELTDSNFNELVLQSDDMWLVEFFAPWCGHCKTLAPHWAQAATELKGKVKLGALDATVHTVMSNRYGVRGFPTIKMFPGGKKDGAEEYEGGRTASDIVAFALDKLSENVPAPELLQLTEESILKRACDDHQLCIVSFLPNILDCQSECRNKYLSILRTLGEKYKKRQWGWVWMESLSQENVETAVGVGGFGYPAMVAINSRKMKYASLKGSFSESGINEFLRELAVGRGSTAPLSEMPKVLKTDSWDGKDGQMPEMEDIDLSDVDLDDLDDKKDEL